MSEKKLKDENIFELLSSTSKEYNDIHKGVIYMQKTNPLHRHPYDVLSAMLSQLPRSFVESNSDWLYEKASSYTHIAPENDFVWDKIYLLVYDLVQTNYDKHDKDLVWKKMRKIFNNESTTSS